MKTKYAVLMVALGMSSMALAQENDDMYFNAKDRGVANRANEVVLAKRYAQEDQTAIKTNPVNPSDSYTGRGVNPEYSSQIKNGTALVQNNPDYFLSNYTPKDINTSLSNGSNSSYYGNNAYSNMCGCNSAFSNYGMGYGMNSMYGMGGMYGMNSMYGMGGYGMNSMYGMGYGYPYGGSYSSMMLGYGFGSGFYGGMGMGYGMGSMYSPYGMYNPYGGYGYPTVVINNNDARVTTHGRRSVRSSDTNSNYVGNTRNGNAVTSNGRAVQGGRVSSGSPDYYNRAWRSDPNVTTRGYYDNNTGSFNRSGYSNGGNNSGVNNNSGTRTRSAWDSGFGGGGNSNSGARSSYGGSSGGGFSGGGGGGGGGGGHSRGR